MTCSNCGKEIGFVKRNGKRMPVDSKVVFVIPGVKGQNYLLANGQFLKGKKSDDGVLCYEIHNC